MLKGLGKFLQHPDDLQSVYAVAASVQGSPMAAQMMRHMLSEPGIAAMIQEQWRPAAIDLDALEQLPAGSLGQCYASQLKAQGITDCYVVGLAFDYCVGHTAIDSAKNGFNTFLISDASAAVADSSKATMET